VQRASPSINRLCCPLRGTESRSATTIDDSPNRVVSFSDDLRSWSNFRDVGRCGLASPIVDTGSVGNARANVRDSAGRDELTDVKESQGQEDGSLDWLPCHPELLSVLVVFGKFIVGPLRLDAIGNARASRPETRVMAHSIMLASEFFAVLHVRHEHTTPRFSRYRRFIKRG
jgi:hypothetical protein